MYLSTHQLVLIRGDRREYRLWEDVGPIELFLQVDDGPAGVQRADNEVDARLEAVHRVQDDLEWKSPTFIILYLSKEKTKLTLSLPHIETMIFRAGKKEKPSSFPKLPLCFDRGRGKRRTLFAAALKPQRNGHEDHIPLWPTHISALRAAPLFHGRFSPFFFFPLRKSQCLKREKREMEEFVLQLHASSGGIDQDPITGFMAYDCFALPL